VLFVFPSHRLWLNLVLINLLQLHSVRLRTSASQTCLPWQAPSGVLALPGSSGCRCCSGSKEPSWESLLCCCAVLQRATLCGSLQIWDVLFAVAAADVLVRYLGIAAKAAVVALHGGASRAQLRRRAQVHHCPPAAHALVLFRCLPVQVPETWRRRGRTGDRGDGPAYRSWR